MFNRIESELKTLGKTKVWLADELNESTQNINNWRTRGVPAAKVLSIAQALSVTREYLEDTTATSKQQVATTKGVYPINKPRDNKINFIVFVDIKDPKVKKLLATHLISHDGMHGVYCSGWKSAEPFLELSIWVDEHTEPSKIYILVDCIVGITEYSESPADS